jgi:Protein of unknown function (DUF4058)
MPSPFPGMDPYLEAEKLWPAFQHQFVAWLYQVLPAGLVDRYRARVGQRQYHVGQGDAGPGVAGDRCEEYIEIVNRSDGRLVTLLDLANPANKTTPEGREAYLSARRAAREAGANLVEIDLVLRGQPLLDYSRDGLPEWDYAVTVTRATQPDRDEIYTTTLQKRLPRFKLPLASDDRDTVLDLQSVFTRCYDQGGFSGQVCYQRDPEAPLPDDRRRWLADLLAQHKLR